MKKSTKRITQGRDNLWFSSEKGFKTMMLSAITIALSTLLVLYSEEGKMFIITMVEVFQILDTENPAQIKINVGMRTATSINSSK